MKRSLLAVPVAALLTAGLAGCGTGSTATAADQCSVLVKGSSEIMTFAGPDAAGLCDQLVADPTVAGERMKVTSLFGATPICHVTVGSNRASITDTPADPNGQASCQEMSKTLRMSAG